MNNINNVKKKYNKKGKYKEKNIKGGSFCESAGANCKNIETRIDPSAVLDKILKAIFFPINFLIKGVFYTIKFIIEYWNDLIIRLSYVFQDLIFNLFYSINGYIDVFNMVIGELKAWMTISLALLTNNPISLLSIWITPFVQEFLDFLMDTASLQMITNIFLIDFSSVEALKKSLNVFKPLSDFLKATYYFLIGKTVKGQCDVSLYGDEQEKNKHCHELYVPKCRLNIRTVYNIVFYVLIVLYFAGWLSFFKIFYKNESNVNIIKFLKERYGSNNE